MERSGIQDTYNQILWLNTTAHMVMLIVLNNTIEPDILQRNICFYRGKTTRVHVM